MTQEEKINVAELLKDCPSGMELDCTICNNVVTLEGVDTVGYYPIRVMSKDGFHHVLTHEGCIYKREDAKCVIFPKGKTTWEGFQRPFMDGDIVVCTNGSCTFTAIFKSMRNDSSFYRYGVMYDNGFRCSVNDWSDFDDSCRLATEEEKAKLFKAIKDNGYKWNKETKTLEKSVEPKFKDGDRVVKKGDISTPVSIVRVGDKYYYHYSNTEGTIGLLPIAEQDDWELVPTKFDITTLIPFESRVLVRNHESHKWSPAMWGYYDCDSQNYPYIIVGDVARYCIPYDKNEHLLGTTNDCDNFFKTW